MIRGALIQAAAIALVIAGGFLLWHFVRTLL